MAKKKAEQKEQAVKEAKAARKKEKDELHPRYELHLIESNEADVASLDDVLSRSCYSI